MRAKLYKQTPDEPKVSGGFKHIGGNADHILKPGSIKEQMHALPEPEAGGSHAPEHHIPTQRSGPQAGQETPLTADDGASKMVAGGALPEPENNHSRLTAQDTGGGPSGGGPSSSTTGAASNAQPSSGSDPSLLHEPAHSSSPSSPGPRPGSGSDPSLLREDPIGTPAWGTPTEPASQRNNRSRNLRDRELDPALQEFAKTSDGRSNAGALRQAALQMSGGRHFNRTQGLIGTAVLAIVIILSSLFSFNFPSLQLTTLVENATKYGMKRMLYTSNERKAKILKQYFKERMLPGSSQTDLHLQNYNTSLLGQLYSTLRDSDFEQRLQKSGIKITYGDPQNPRVSKILRIEYLNQAVDPGNFSASYDLTFQKKAARNEVKRIVNNAYRDESSFKRLIVRRRITHYLGVNWHWFDPIKQPLKAARVKAANMLVEFLVEKSPFAKSALIKVIEMLTGEDLGQKISQEVAQKIAEETSKEAAEHIVDHEVLRKIEAKVISDAMEKAIGMTSNPVGWAILAVNSICVFDKVSNEGYPTYVQLVEDKATGEYGAAGAEMVSRMSQLNSGQTNGTAVDAFFGGVMVDSIGRDWSMAANVQRANGRVVPFTPTDDCTTITEICNSKRPTVMALMTTTGKALLALKEVNDFNFLKYIPGIPEGIASGSQSLSQGTLRLICTAWNKVSNYVIDNATSVALTTSPLWQVLKSTGVVDWAQKYSDKLSKEYVIDPLLSSILMPPVVDGGTRGPARGNATVAGTIAMGNLNMRDEFGTLDPNTAGDYQAAQKAKLSPADATALNRAADQELADEFHSLPWWEQLTTTDYAFAPMNQVIASLPSSPQVAVLRFGNFLSATISPHAITNLMSAVAHFFTNLSTPSDAAVSDYPEMYVGITPYGPKPKCIDNSPILSDETTSGCTDDAKNKISFVKHDTGNICSLMAGPLNYSVNRQTASLPAECGSQPPVNLGLGGKWLSGASSIEHKEQDFGTWRGSPTGIVGTWSDNSAECQATQCALSGYDDWNGAVDAAIGGFYGGESWQSAASGAYDTRFRQALQQIYAHWGSKTIVFIRFAHEFNGDWYDWKVTSGNVDAFKTTWQHVHQMVKEELIDKGKNAQLVWSPNDGNHSDATAEQMWPGDQYVDVVGVDSYGWEGDTAAPTAGSIDNPRGIEMWRQFAQKHGKPMSFPEWGTDPSHTYDEPQYIKDMNTFMTQHAGSGPGQIIYDVYFNAWGADKIYPDTSVPNSVSMYKSLKWGQ
ncbi:MAG TPA: glycosyl hydrolase [Candidatus Saccharimonadia bacterium]